MKRVLAAALLSAAAFTLPAQAATIVLGGQNWDTTGVDNLQFSTVVPGGNQPQNIQCVICGANQPQQQADFGYTDFKNQGSTSGILMFSTNIAGGANPGNDTVGTPYGIGFLQAYLLANGDGSLNFSIGIDVNDNNTPQTLNSFFLLNLTTHTVLSAYTPDTLLPNQNNGTGFPDFQLTGFNIQFGTDIHVGDNLLFFARMSNMSDGPDSFFIQPAAVPGPIVGAGIPGIAMALGGMWGLNRFRRRRSVA